MSIVRAVLDDVTAIGTATSDDLAAFQTALQTGQQTTASVRTFLASMTAQRAAIRDVRATLDAVDLEAQQIYDDAAVTLTLWQTERAIRWALAGLDARLTTALGVAREVLLGRGQTRHAVRRGETIQSIAATYLGDWRQWPAIAAANGLDSSAVAVGSVLVIPQRV